MAIAIPHKPRYRDRTLPIYYLVGDRMLLRRRPASVHDPRTPAQLRQRLRLRVASRFLKGFRPMVAEGFAPEELDNLRRVGAYQQALSRLMRGALVETPEGVAIDASRVLLSEGYGAPLGAVRARAAGGTLRLAWEEELPKGCGTLLVGVWHRGLEQAQCHRLAVAPHGAGKRGRYDSAHCVAAPATTTAGSATRQTASAANATRHATSLQTPPRTGLSFRGGGAAGRPAAQAAAETARRPGAPPPPAGGHLLRAATAMRGAREVFVATWHAAS